MTDDDVARRRWEAARGDDQPWRRVEFLAPPAPPVDDDDPSEAPDGD